MYISKVKHFKLETIRSIDYLWLSDKDTEDFEPVLLTLDQNNLSGSNQKEN